MPTPSIPVEIQPIVRIRVRCSKAHTDPWLRRLYVVWAAVPADATPPAFALAQSDEKGYLSPVMNQLDPAVKATLPLFPNIDYHFYFVRHPSAAFAQDIITELNADFAATSKKYGAPRTRQAVLTQTGVDKKKKAIMEGVISVEEDPAWFIQNGSPFYGGWALFRDMPGTGSNVVNTDVQCEVLAQQVRRLQFQLGRLRYPIGNQWHPYSPEPWTEDAARKKAKAKLPGKLYPNEGLFDICTWNAVIRFQREARNGEAAKLDPAKPRTPTLAPDTFDPLPAAEDRELEMAESHNFVTDTDASPGEAFAAIPEAVESIVEVETANAIQQWLKNDLRKPGKILVNRGAWDSWMQQDASATAGLLDAELKRLGVNYGLRFNNAFRDTRMSVITPGAGQIINSIHKSGFAFDMAMTAYVDPLKNAPLYYEKDPSVTSGVKWIVWAEAQIARIPPEPHEDYVEYKDSVNRWKYDADSPDGGSTQPPFSLPGVKFLNFSKVCDHFLLRRIGAHTSGWQGTDPVTYTLDSADNFNNFLSKFLQEADQAPNAPTAVAKVDGKQFLFSLLPPAAKYLSSWKTATRALNPTPEVYIEPWTKEGEKVIRALRGKDFVGKSIRVSVAGPWIGGNGASGFPQEPSPTGTSEGTIELSATAEFPTLYAFTASPITTPISIEPGSVVELPGLGHPAHMEWWHFQYEPGYSGKLWKDILDLIGWLPEGLLGKEGAMPIFGLYGMGYLTKHLNAKAN